MQEWHDSRRENKKTAEAQYIFLESWWGHPSNQPGNVLPPLNGGRAGVWVQGGVTDVVSEAQLSMTRTTTMKKKMQYAVQVISLVLAWTNACCTSLTTFRTWCSSSSSKRLVPAHESKLLNCRTARMALECSACGCRWAASKRLVSFLITVLSKPACPLTVQMLASE